MARLQATLICSLGIASFCGGNWANAQERVFWTSTSTRGMHLVAPKIAVPFGTFETFGSSCSNDLRSESLQWQVEGLPVFNYSLRVLHSPSRTFIVNGTLPSSGILAPIHKHTNLQQLGYDDGVAGWIVEEHRLVPVWKVMSPGQNQTWIIDAHSGSVLDERPAWWHSLAGVPARVMDPITHKTKTVQLSGLTSKKHLDGHHVRVFAPDNNSPRVEQDDHGFIYSPHGSEGFEFDQVQAYYSATTMRSWFAQRIDEALLTPVTIHIDHPQMFPGNAGYNVMTQSIAIGSDNDHLQRLARDFDVVAHEYGHHFVAKFVPTNRGDAAILHEGLADYFVYAFKNRPVLTELATTTQDYLRSARVDESERFDNPNIGSEAHDLGRLWSAFLWQVRKKFGESFDHVVLRSVMALSEQPTLSEAIELLLAADESLVDSHHLATSSRCAILDAAIDRGLATWIEHLDGSACSFDFEQLARESRAYSAGIRGNDSPARSLSNPCGVISASTDAENPVLALAALFFIPFIVFIGHRFSVCKKPKYAGVRS